MPSPQLTCERAESDRSLPRRLSGPYLTLCFLLLAGCGLAAGLDWRRLTASAEAAAPQTEGAQAIAQSSAGGLRERRPGLYAAGSALPFSYEAIAGEAGQLRREALRPTALASADFDEDGVPDLVGGYAAGERGALTLNRGNADAAYPHSPEAARRRAEGVFSESPFLSPGRAFDLDEPPSFLGAGDFDGDGHWDVAAANRGGRALYILRGDGRGSLGRAHKLGLEGVVTSLATGDINRADGLADIVVAVEREAGAAVLVFEGPGGALGSEPEVLPLPSAPTSMTIGQLDGEPSFDLAAVAGRELFFVRGRDRKLSLDATARAQVPPAKVGREEFSTNLMAVTAGDFTAGPRHDLAVLSADGELRVLSRAEAETGASAMSRGGTAWRQEALASGEWSAGTQLIAARSSDGLTEDVLIHDAAAGRVQLAGRAPSRHGEAAAAPAAAAPVRDVLAHDAGDAVAAVLPMQLDPDAVPDLVFLRHSPDALAVSLTAGAGHALSGVPSAAPGPASLKQKSSGGGPPDLSTLRGGAHPPARAGIDSLDGARAEAAGRRGPPQAAAAPCGFVEGLAPGTIRDGVLDAGLDCRYPLTGELFDSYTFNGIAGQRIAIEVVSSVFDPALILTAPGGVRVFQNDDNRDGTNSRIPPGGGYITLPVTGTYILDVTTIYIEAAGPYRVSISALGPTQCTETPIESGNLFIDALTFADCVDNFGTRLDFYSFFGVASQQVAIYMDTNPIEFNPFLILFPPSGLPISNDNGGDGFNDARIPAVAGTLTLTETGVYRIAATSAFTNQFGAYALELLVTGPTVVTNTNDSGPGSLRQAILNANARPGPDIITFAIGSGARTINLLSPLPPVSGVTSIDGTTQPGFAGVPLIELNGGGIPAAGIKLTAGASRVRGLVINRFNYGVAITDAGGNIVEGNYIGTNLSGTAALPNQIDGVVVFSSRDNLIGGTTAAARNVISGNLNVGVEIGRNGPFNNRVQGNFIGTNAAGTGDLGNRANGVLIRVGTSNLIGGTVPGARNVISGNDLPGVALGHTEPVGNLVQGNFIGTNAAGTAALGNNGAGLIFGGVDVNVNLVTATKNTVGGTTAAARNVISGNFGQGVEINNRGSAENFVQGNFIGTNAAGTAALGNNGVGVSVTSAPGNVIGGAAAGAGNLISANQGPFGIGVAIGIPRDGLTGGTGIIVQGNAIGTDFSRTLRLGNAQDGVFVDAQSVVNTVADNAIAFNGLSGVYIPNNGTEPGVQIRIENNDIFANAQLAIDLGARGVTGNDPLDTDVGANLQQNFPTLQSATLAAAAPLAEGEEGAASAAATVTVTGTLQSTPNTVFTVQWGFTADAQCSPQNQPQSRVLVTGKMPGVQTNANGIAPLTLSLTLPASVERGVIYTNAIDPSGNTSENSPCLTVSSTPPPAGTLQFSAASYSVGEGDGSATITVTRTAGSTGPVGVSFLTADGTARAGQDYTASVGVLSFASGVTSRTFTIPITNDALNEDNETISLALTGPTGGAVLGPQVAAAVTILDNDNPSIVQFDAAGYAGSEAAGTAVVRVARSGATSQAVSIDYETLDQTANERRDYIMTMGRLEFAPGETLKTITVLVNNDAYAEPSETLLLRLSNPSSGATLGARATATVTISSDDAVTGPNPIDTSEFYVRQQYADFLNRQADAGGLAHWKNDLDTQTATHCAPLADPGARLRCVLGVRSRISAAFFLSIEFQQTGFLVIRFYAEAFGRLPRLREFTADAQEVGRGVIVGTNGWDVLLEANRIRYAERLTERAEFIQRYGTMSDANFVNTLFANAGVTQGEDALRQALINGLANRTETRASVLRKVADSGSVFNRQYNPGFVLMQYFGYLRRNPDDVGFDGNPDPQFLGFNFWLTKMNSFTTLNEDARDETTALGRAQRAQMVDAFVDSIEYRNRFAP
jgi:hypothetical protein